MIIFCLNVRNEKTNPNLALGRAGPLSTGGTAALTNTEHMSVLKVYYVQINSINQSISVILMVQFVFATNSAKCTPLTAADGYFI